MFDQPSERLRRRADQLRRQLPPRPAATSPPDPGERLTTLARARGQELRVSWTSYKGHPYVAVRVWQLGPDGDWWPTKNAGSLRLHELPAVADVLLRAMDRAAAHFGPAHGDAPAPSRPAHPGASGRHRAGGRRIRPLDRRRRRPQQPSAPPVADPGERLATLDRGEGRQLRVSWCRIEDRPLISVRIWASRPDGSSRPSRGYTIRLHELPAFAEAIAQAVDRARPRLGLPRGAARSLMVPNHPPDDGRGGAEGADWGRVAAWSSSRMVHRLDHDPGRGDAADGGGDGLPQPGSSGPGFDEFAP